MSFYIPGGRLSSCCLVFPPTVALYIPSFYPACQAPPLNLARPSAPFTDSTIYSSAAWPGQCVCVCVCQLLGWLTGWGSVQGEGKKFAVFSLVSHRRVIICGMTRILTRVGFNFSFNRRCSRCSCRPTGGASEHDWEMLQCLFAFDENCGMSVVTLLPSTAGFSWKQKQYF